MRNAYAAKLLAAKQALIRTQRKELVHRCITTIFQASAIALHDEFGFGPERIKRFQKTMERVIMEYGVLMDGTDVDYADGKLDHQCKKIMEAGKC